MGVSGRRMRRPRLDRVSSVASRTSSSASPTSWKRRTDPEQLVGGHADCDGARPRRAMATPIARATGADRPTGATWPATLAVAPCRPAFPRCGARRSASPTAAPAPTPPRTRSRPSAWPSGWAPPGWRATCGGPPTASPCSTTTASSGGACAGCRSPSSSAASCPSHIPTLAELYAEVGTDLELSLDVKDPDAFAPTVGGGPGGRRRRTGAPVALPPRLAAGGVVAAARPGGAPRRLHLAEAHPRGRRAAGRGPGRRRRRRAEPPPQRVERRARRARPPVRAPRVRLGRPARPHPRSELLDMGLDARLLRPRGPHGRPPSSALDAAARAPTGRRCCRGPDLDEGAAHHRVDGDRPAVRRSGCPRSCRGCRPSRRCGRRGPSAWGSAACRW